MGVNDYHFKTHWRFEAAPERIYDLLSKPENYSLWIKGFPIQVKPLTSGNTEGVGRTERFTVKGYLPYTLSWDLCCIEAKRPQAFTSVATGDLEGQGTWIFTPEGPWTDVVFEWKVAARKPLLRHASFLLRPLFEWNHDWIMDRWERDLRQALALV